MAEMFVHQIFRYQGEFNWESIYHKSRDFFLHKGVKPKDIKEKKYKDKVNSVEVVWEMKQNYDEITQFVYKIEFKADPAKPLGGGKYKGKLKIIIDGGTEDHYKESTPAGEQKIFQKDGLLKKMYDKITRRDRSDGTEDIVPMYLDEFMALLKKECGMETG